MEEENSRLPPGPRGLPIVGYLPYLSSDNLHIQLAQLAQKYGPIYKFWLGNKFNIVITSPSLMKEVLRDHDVIFANRAHSVADRVASYNTKDVAFSGYGAEWRMSRRLFMRELMSNNNLDGSYVIRKDEVRKQIKNVYSKIGSSVNICELTLRITMNTLMRMTFGLEEGDKTATEFIQLVSSLSEGMSKPNISDFFSFLARFDIQGIEKQMNKVMQIIDRIFENLINKCSSSMTINKGSKDYVQMLVELMDKEDEKMSFTRTHAKAMLTNVIGGGTQTSAATVEWVMAELMNNPKEMEKVYKELNEVVGFNHTVEESHIPKLEYLDAVIKETLRLHPIGPFLTPRAPSESCIVGGFTVPKGSTIFLSLWSIYTDPLVWNNPSEFKPERFLGNTGNFDYSGNNFNYIPFGSGRRICAGLTLVNKMVKYVVASLLHSFEWKLPEDEKFDMEDKFDGLLKKRNPLFAVPLPRLSDSNLYLYV